LIEASFLVKKNNSLGKVNNNEGANQISNDHHPQVFKEETIFVMQ
jgi:hypothetical protein